MISSCKLRLYAAATLLAWLGATYHDVWLAAADLAHHHDHHSHNEPHDGDGDDDHDAPDSLPVPDIHSTPVQLSGVTCTVTFNRLIRSITVDGWVGSVFNGEGCGCAAAEPPAQRL